MIAVRLLPRPVVAIIALVVALAMAVPLMGAKGGGAGGNSAVAKMCQKGGWETLSPSTDPRAGFASETECVAYGAGGGTIVALDQRGPAEAYCIDVLGGQYATRLPGAQVLVRFTCSGAWEDSDVLAPLRVICAAEPYVGRASVTSAVDSSTGETYYTRLLCYLP